MSNHFMPHLQGPREEQEIAAAILERELDPDFALISYYAAKELDAESAEQVRRRLESDPAFRDLAAPLLLAADLPPMLEPLGRDELTRSWLRLRRRAGMPAVDGQQDPRVAADLGAFHARIERRRTRGVRRRALAVASATALLLLAPYAILEYRASSAREETGAEVAHRLPDGSTWTAVRPGTSVTYLNTFPNGRQLYLEGDARFDVVQGSGDFVVFTPGAEVVVTGTSFTVKTDARGTTSVAVHEGQVLLRGRFDDPAGQRRAITLVAGQAGRVKRNGQPEGGLIHDGFRN